MRLLAATALLLCACRYGWMPFIGPRPGDPRIYVDAGTPPSCPAGWTTDCGDGGTCLCDDERPYCEHVLSIEDRRLFCGPKTLAVDAGALAVDAGHARVVSPLLDSESDLSQFRCSALGVAPNDIFWNPCDPKGQMYGTYWPATCADDLPPGSILADGRRVLGCRDNRPRPNARACWYADGGFEVLRLSSDGGAS